jgi:hypothetical protein
MLDIEPHHAWGLPLQALFMIANPLPVRSTTTPRTINTFISTLRYRGDPEHTRSSHYPGADEPPMNAPHVEGPAMLAAMRGASSRVSKRAAERRPGFSSKMGVGERLTVELRPLNPHHAEARVGIIVDDQDQTGW